MVKGARTGILDPLGAGAMWTSTATVHLFPYVVKGFRICQGGVGVSRGPVRATGVRVLG